MHAPNPAQFKNDPAYLRALVERAQLAQSEMAERIGVDARTFRRYVTGESGFAYPVQFAVECVTRAVEAEALSANDFRQMSARELTRTVDEAMDKLKRAPATSAAYRRTLKTLQRVEREVRRRSNGK
jgi:transcriptional regulator with XRE-family HTH domain